MMFPGFSHLFAISDPFLRSACRLEFPFESSPSRRLRAELLTPVRVQCAFGKVMHLWLWTTSASTPIVHHNLLRAFEDEGITGWDTYPVEVVGPTGHVLHDFAGLAVRGRCGSMTREQSAIELKEFPGGWYPRLVGQTFDESSWDGSDFFMSPNMQQMYCTERVVRICTRTKAKNVAFESLSQTTVEVSTAKGSSIPLPTDLEARVARAYEHAGVLPPRVGAGSPDCVETRYPLAERPISLEAVAELNECRAQALPFSGSVGDSKSEVARALSEYVEAVRPLGEEEAEQVALQIGIKFGDLICSAAGWSWVELEQGGDWLAAVVAPDRSYCVAPVPVVSRILTDEEAENNLDLLFRMIAEHTLPVKPARAYTSLLG